MINIYCFLASVSRSDVEMVVLTSEILEDVDTFFNILVNITVILGGILGLNYIRKLQERQIDSIFSYLTRLNIRLKFFHELLITYKDDIMDRFVPESERREISADRISLVIEAINHLSENANETLKFLMSEDNQMPAQQGWINCFNIFIEFLIDCEHLNQVAYFKWIAGDDLEEKKQQYYDKNLRNIDNLLDMVYKRQSKLESDIFKKSI